MNTSIVKIPPELTNILQSCTNAADLIDQERFVPLFLRLLAEPFLTPLLGCILSGASENRITFQLPKPNAQYHPTEGHCETVAVPLLAGLLQKITPIFKHKIEIRRLIPEVLIHEIAHAIEREAHLVLKDAFLPALTKDLSQLHHAPFPLKQVVNTIMNRELGSYPKAHHEHELFARFYQLSAMSREIAGQNATSGLSILHIRESFLHVMQWHNNILIPILAQKTSPFISQLIDQHLRKNAHSPLASGWNETIRPRHSQQQGPKWRNSTRSIFSNPSDDSGQP
jgi:hypothetical protein